MTKYVEVLVILHGLTAHHSAWSRRQPRDHVGYVVQHFTLDIQGHRVGPKHPSKQLTTHASSNGTSIMDTCNLELSSCSLIIAQSGYCIKSGGDEYLPPNLFTRPTAYHDQ